MQSHGSEFLSQFHGMNAISVNMNIVEQKEVLVQ